MFEYIKQRILKSLIEEIECIDAVNLELVGHNVISILENTRMIHHGINKNYRPSGYTVDSFTDDSLTITEYSADKDFFKDTSKKTDTIPFFDKVENDINHAINHVKPKRPNKIYLLTSQSEPPSFRSKFNETLVAQTYSDIIVIYDSRELAKIIYEQSISSVDSASYYKQFFPGYSQNLDNYEYYGRVPSICNKHVSYSYSIEAVKKHLESNNICVLNGISGSGKTQLIIDFIHSKKDKFENYLWISGEDWKKDTSLSSIQRTRGGAPVNISGLFNTSKTILIIDDLNRAIYPDDLKELSDGFSLGGKLIITSQISKNSDIYLPVPELSDIVATQILGEIFNQETNLCKDVVKLCKSSPLILSTIRNLVDEEGVAREELYKEVLKYPNDITDNNGKSIMGGILSKLEPNSLIALKEIANSGSRIHDSEFLSHFITALNRINLQRLSILLPASVPGCLKIHDIIYVSIQDKPNSKNISEAIGTYINKHSASMSPSVIREIHICYDIIYQEYRVRKNTTSDWITYALLQVEGDKKNEIQKTIYKEKILADMNLSSVLTIIDAKEAQAFSIEDTKERLIYYKNCIQEYLLLQKTTKNDEVKKELLHHLGKAYRRCGLHNEALNCFTELLSIEPNLHATQLQIVHLGSHYDVDKLIKDEGERYLNTLIDSILDDYSLVPLRVSLGAFNKLRSYKNLYKSIDSSTEKVEKIANIIASSSFEGFGQFYEAFVAFTSMFGYHHSMTCLKLIENIPELLSTAPDSLDKKNWSNACEGFANLAIAANNECKSKLSKRIINSSLSFADKIFDFKKLSNYEVRILAKAYIIGDNPNKALLAIDKIPEKDHNHWVIYRKAEAQLKINSSEALNSAKTALDLALNDPYATNNIPSYHDLFSQCAKQMIDIELAIVQAKLAYEKCDDNKYKTDLKERLDQLVNNH